MVKNLIALFSFAWLTALILFIAVFLTSCLGLPKGNKKLRKAQRKIERARQLAPELFIKDTLVIRDTIIVESVFFDTSTKVIFNDKIVVVNNDRIRVEYYYDTITETIEHFAECKGDTVIKIHEIIVEKITSPTLYDQARPWFPWLWVILIILIVAFLWKKIFYL